MCTHLRFVVCFALFVYCSLLLETVNVMNEKLLVAHFQFTNSTLNEVLLVAALSLSLPLHSPGSTVAKEWTLELLATSHHR